MEQDNHTQNAYRRGGSQPNLGGDARQPTQFSSDEQGPAAGVERANEGGHSAPVHVVACEDEHAEPEAQGNEEEERDPHSASSSGASRAAPSSSHSSSRELVSVAARRLRMSWMSLSTRLSSLRTSASEGVGSVTGPSGLERRRLFALASSRGWRLIQLLRQGEQLLPHLVSELKALAVEDVNPRVVLLGQRVEAVGPAVVELADVVEQRGHGDDAQ